MEHCCTIPHPCCPCAHAGEDEGADEDEGTGEDKCPANDEGAGEDEVTGEDECDGEDEGAGEDEGEGIPLYRYKLRRSLPPQVPRVPRVWDVTILLRSGPGSVHTMGIQ